MSNREVRLEQMVDGLRREVRRLEVENNELRIRLEESEYRVRSELEPRIKADERRYDAWALSPERGY